MDHVEQLDSIGRHETEHNEWIIFGPPGCGKTTHSARQIRRAVERFGKDSVLVTSFSRAAAAELVGKDLPLPKHSVGTLHSHCFRALGMPKIAEANISTWNDAHQTLQISPHGEQSCLDGEDVMEDGSKSEMQGDYWLGELNRARARMIAPEYWNPFLREFHALWCRWKQEAGYLDFTDLVETCINDVKIAPGDPRVLFGDEAQDFSKLEMALFRRWARYADYAVLAGDDDQTIYAFKGGSAESMLDGNILADHKIVLKQSHRVPAKVHAVANQWIQQVRRRQAKEYYPRVDEWGKPVTGNVARLVDVTWKNPERLVGEHITAEIESGRTCMVLATCSYILGPTISALKAAGIPYQNEYRMSNGAWNPLRRETPGSAANRVIALLEAHAINGEWQRPWTAGELYRITEWLTSEGVLRRGAKSKLKQAPADQVVTEQDLVEVFSDAALDELIAGLEAEEVDKLLGWWQSHLKTNEAKRVEFSVSVVKRLGLNALAEPPMVTVGTGHSVKGGQKDVVYIFPDLSREGWSEYERPESRDHTTRLAYVMMTRAREKLYLCSPASPMAINI